MRILAIDYGTKTTGLAITDYSQLIVSPLMSITASNDEDLIKQIKNKLEYYLYETNKIIIGYPTLLSGNKNATTYKVEAFMNKLVTAFPKIQIIPVNEQFTTYVATEELYDSGLEHKQIKKQKDKVSACLILETYLNNQNIHDKK